MSKTRAHSLCRGRQSSATGARSKARWSRRSAPRTTTSSSTTKLDRSRRRIIRIFEGHHATSTICLGTSSRGLVDPQPDLADLRRVITTDKCKALLIDLVQVPSPQTALMEAEPLLRRFIETAVEPRLRAMGFADIRYDSRGNLISTCGAGR